MSNRTGSIITWTVCTAIWTGDAVYYGVRGQVGMSVMAVAVALLALAATVTRIRSKS